MKKILLVVFLYHAGFTSLAQSKILPSESQIKTALLAAPADKRDGAAVLGYSSAKELVLLRKGSNELICLADDPDQAGLSVACYHKDLEPFMKMGRTLKKQGKSSGEIFAMREQEAKAGKLIMPKQPTTLFVYSASKDDYDDATGEVKNGYLRYVIYIPYATAESTGLPLKPEVAAMPWIMNPGTHAAHIMINPPKN